MKDKIIEFLKDEDGQTSTEYILLIAVVAAVIYKFKDVLTSKLTDPNDGLLAKVFNKADSLIEQ